MNNPSERSGQDQRSKYHRSKSREIGSRFLSSPSSSSAVGSTLPPPDPSISPVRPKPKPRSSVSKHRSASDDTSLLRSLWPSSVQKTATLADHLGNDRLIDFIEDSKPIQLHPTQPPNRRRSCSEFTRSDKDSSKENRPIGGSMRFTGKLRFPGKSAPSPAQGRFSVDEKALDPKQIRRRSDSFSDLPSSESEKSDMSASSRRSGGIEVPARFTQDPASRRRSAESGPVLSETGANSPSASSSPAKVAMKRSSSVTAYGSTATQWALSPGRTGFSSLRPRSPSSSSSTSSASSSTLKGGKGMGSLLSMGLELFKGKKSSSVPFPSSSSSPRSGGGGGGVDGEAVHQLRLLHNKVLQWRLVNAKADAVNASKVVQAEATFLNAWATLSQLQYSVVQKRIQLEKERLQLKLNKVLHSQIKPLEEWTDMERQHHSAISTTKDCLHGVVCRVPLIEGAQGDTQPISMMLRHATDLTASIKTMTADFSPMAQKNTPLLSELAEVVIREKTLLQECFELISVVANLELQERSLRCQLIQLKSLQQQQLLQHEV
ncbi:hypothetical protein AAC387_Pa06g2131 [Persea americana]